MRRFPLMTALYCSLALCVFHNAPVKADGEVAALMELARKSEPTGYSSVDSVEPEQVFAELIPYKNDPDERVRSQAISIAAYVSRQSKELSIRQMGVEYLVDAAITDPTSHAASSLEKRSPIDFSSVMREKIRHELALDATGNVRNHYSFAAFISVAGEIDLRSAIPILRKIAATGDSNRQHDAKLALARMGDEEAIRSMVEYFESNFNPESRIDSYFIDLEYMRQPESIEILVRYLFSDEVPPRESVDLPNSSYASHAYRAMLYSVVGFYQRFEGKGSLDSRILKARQWVKEHGAENLESIR